MDISGKTHIKGTFTGSLGLTTCKKPKFNERNDYH
jgi:hypothetical protein